MVFITGLLSLVLGIISIKWAFGDGEEWGILVGMVLCILGVTFIGYGLSNVVVLVK